MIKSKMLILLYTFTSFSLATLPIKLSETNDWRLTAEAIKISKKPSKWWNVGKERLRSHWLRLSACFGWLNMYVHFVLDPSILTPEKQAHVDCLQYASHIMLHQKFAVLYHFKLVIFFHFQLNCVHFSAARKTIKARLFSAASEIQSHSCEDFLCKLCGVTLIDFCDFSSFIKCRTTLVPLPSHYHKL